MDTLSEALQKLAYAVQWRTAAFEAIANGAPFRFLPR